MTDLDRLRALYPLPWRTDLAVEPGVIFAADGTMVLSVDTWSDRPDFDVHVVAKIIVQAVNLVGRMPSVFVVSQILQPTDPV
jgi:hypothetical protein